MIINTKPWSVRHWELSWQITGTCGEKRFQDKSNYLLPHLVSSILNIDWSIHYSINFWMIQYDTTIAKQLLFSMLKRDHNGRVSYHSTTSIVKVATSHEQHASFNDFFNLPSIFFGNLPTPTFMLPDHHHCPK